MKKLKFLLFFQVLYLTAIAQQLPEIENNGNQIKELFFAGLKDKLAENYPKANTNFQKIIGLDSQNDAAYFELANISLLQNKLFDAETNIKRAVAIKPTNIWYLQFLSELYKRNGNMDELVVILDQLIKLSPERAYFYFDRANALYIAGSVDESKKAYQAIAEKFGQSKELLLAQQRFSSQNKEQNVNHLLAENPTDVKNFLAISGILLNQKKYDEALVLLQKAKNLEADNFEVDLAMSDIYRALKKPDLVAVALKAAFANEAMPVANKIKIVSGMLHRFNNPTYVKDATELASIALQAHPNDLQLITLYGDVLYQQGNIILAKEQYQKALKISAQFYTAYEKILGIQTLTGDYEGAIETSEEALTYFPNQAVTYYYRAFALHRKGQNAEAALEIKTAQALTPDNDLLAMIYALQAEVFIDQQKLKDADVSFDKAIALAPENYLILSNYAYYLALRENNLPKAEILAAKAAKALSTNPSVLDTYALVLFKLGKYNDALIWREKSLQNKEAANPVYLEHYGDILYLSGDKDLALLQWQKAKSLGNTSEKLTKKINEKRYFK